MMLYLTLPDMDLLSEQPKNYHFESFTPTDDSVTQGWVVVAVYTQYDSFEHSPEKYYQVIDFYGVRDAAMSAANTLYDNERNYDISKRDVSDRPQAYFADGSVVKNLAFAGWGSSLEEIIIKRCKLQEHQDIVRLN